MTDFTDPDEALTADEERPFTDQEATADEADELVTNDAVAGEPVWPGGEGSDGSSTEPNWDRFAPGESGPDESQPFGDKTPDDLRDHLD
ncbi:MAG: hypothetical protein Q7T71_04960, partial [Herbiconiux sp.]|nr:hypothetical protein [Herbiconiux sp.]